MTENDDSNDPMNLLIEHVTPQLSKLTFGGVIGYCSGAAAKKVGKAAAIFAGFVFIAVQSAVYSGYVAVDWNKVKDDAVAKVDTVSCCLCEYVIRGSFVSMHAFVSFVSMSSFLLLHCMSR